MSKIHMPIAETTVNGPRTLRWGVDVEGCKELAAHRIARLGIDEALPPYRRVRLRPQGSFLMATVAGTGRVLLDGRWQKIKAGTVCMAPPRVLNAFFAEGRERWVFAWVRYEESVSVLPLVGASSPVVLSRGAEDLARVIEGLRAEWEGARDPKLLHHWVEMAHGLCRRFAQPFQVNERMRKLWDAVDAALENDWSLAKLARVVHLSVEHLRRLCHQELGRSPMQHLTYMRMQRARVLLETTEDKLDVVAGSVGYGNAFIFSRVFKRWVGCAPSVYREVK
jgi:AraC-like DNA-binding protein